MAQFVNIYDVDLMKPSAPRQLRQMVCEGDAKGNRVGANVYSDGSPVSLGGQCVGKVVRADGTTVQLTGTVSGNQAYVVLDQTSCAIEGPVQVAVCWVSGTNITTLVVAYGAVINTQTGTAIQPSTPIPDLTQLLAEIDNMRQATAAAEAAAEGALANFAPAFSESTAYEIGQYVTYTDGKLYEFTSAHAAGIWNGSHVRAVTTANEIIGLKDASNALFDMSMSGMASPAGSAFGEWGYGFVDGTTGVVNKSLIRRICQYNIVSTDYAVPISIKNGFMITVTYYNGGVFSYTDYNIIGEYVIPAGREFRITIRRVTEDMSETADFAEFLGALTITSGLLIGIEEAKANADSMFSKIVQFSPNPNLIDWLSISLDAYLETNGTTSSNANNWTSDYIEVESGKEYVYSFAANQSSTYLGNVVFYDANKTRLSYVNNVMTFTTPADCKYIKVCRQYHSASGTGSAAGINSSNYLTADYYINKTNLQVGSAGTIPQNDYLAPNIHVPTWYKGKKVLSYGDSIVELNTWQPHCRKYLGTDTFWNGGGVGGTTVYNNGGQVTFPGTSTPVDSWMCSDGRINRIKGVYGAADCIIVLAGHNDWSESCPIGEIGDTLVDSNFKSAYALMLKKLVEGFPNSRIICCTPINGRVQTAGVNQDVQMKNQLGLCITDYANAVIDVCRHYGIPCIDLNGETGISVLNAATYIGDVVHPNAAGGKLIANAVINGMKRFEPIVF